MKRSCILILALALLLLAGCGEQTYPRKSSSPYMEHATDAPKTLYTTSAEENGLAGNIYAIKGTVSKYLDSSEMDGVTTFVVSTKNGDAVFADMYSKMQSNVFSAALTAEADSDYSLPETGEHVRVIGIYVGYSGKLDMPVFYFGANEAIVEMARG